MSLGQGVGWGLNFVFFNVSDRKMRDSESIFFHSSLCTLFRKNVNMVSLCTLFRIWCRFVPCFVKIQYGVVMYPVSEKCEYGVVMYPVSNMVSLCTLFRKKVNMVSLCTLFRKNVNRVSLCYEKCNMESLCTLFRKNPDIPKLTKSVWDATQLFSPLTVYIYCGADVRIRRESGSGWLLSLSV